MHRKCRHALIILAMPALLGMVATARTQSRKLGPETAKAIQESKLDPAFQTTKLDRIALFPLANTAQYKEAAGVVSKNLVAQLSQLHPEYKFVPPDELINFVSTSRLDDEFNVFLGDYLASRTARRDFLETLRSKLQIDAVLVGQILQYGETKTARTSGFIRFGSKKEYLVGLEMSLYRTMDGRRLWYGKDSIAAKNQDNLLQAAQVIGEVFARFLGRVPY